MKLLDYIIATREAQSEEDVLRFLADAETVCNPTLDDRKTMGNLYEDTLGHNPLEVYDEHDVIHELDAIYEVAPTNVQEKIDLKRDEIIEKCMKCISEIREDVIGSITAQAVKVETGWIDPEMEYQIPLAIIRFLSGEEDGFEIDPDDIVPDEETTDDDDEEEEDYESSDEDDDLNLDLAEMLGDDVD